MVAPRTLPNKGVDERVLLMEKQDIYGNKDRLQWRIQKIKNSELAF